jgi:hypothetical protein
MAASGSGSSGTIPIQGTKYTWTSPSLLDLMEFEAQVGPLTDLTIVNSVRGRCYLAFLCLREKHQKPLSEIHAWPAEAFNELWPMIVAAVPFWEAPRPPAPKREALEGEGEGSPDSSTSSSSTSSGSPVGHPPAPEGNE